MDHPIKDRYTDTQINRYTDTQLLPDEYAYRAIFHDAFVHLVCVNGFVALRKYDKGYTPAKDNHTEQDLTSF